MTTFWDLIVAAGEAVPTKREFGERMHDPDLPEEEKQAVLETVADAGGYENLPDD
jgi:hypothetical protein